MSFFLDRVNRIVWGAPMLVLILGTGMYVSIRTNFVQIRLLPHALKIFWEKFRLEPGEDGVSPFQALCTALAATVGTGNLVGVAGAIAIGGPGSIFWMWVCGVIGMATKFAEATLAVRYRVCRNGECLAGPMYMITRALGKPWHPLAYAYCAFGIFAAFGVGNAVQINSVISGLNGVIEYCGGSVSWQRNLIMGLFLALLVGGMLLGGAKRIGRATELLMPFVSCCYILLCLGLLLLRADAIPAALGAIIKGAFMPGACAGGIMGSAFVALRTGVSRGVFTNEAGMGTAAIAHGSAEVSHPVEQGLMGILEVFLDTIVICSLTAFVILCSGVPIPYGEEAGVELTRLAFHSVYGPWVTVFLGVALCCFAFATVLGWGLYGIRCVQFIFGGSSWKGFALLQTAVVFLSVFLETATVWSLAETVNGLMAIPNLIVLLKLCPELVKLTFEYQ